MATWIEGPEDGFMNDNGSYGSPVTYAISLSYSCGCTESWPVILPPPPDDVSHTIAEPCVPEKCQTCLARGRMCQDRENARLYSAIEFVEMLPVARIQTRRRKA